MLYTYMDSAMARELASQMSRYLLSYTSTKMPLERASKVQLKTVMARRTYLCARNTLGLFDSPAPPKPVSKSADDDDLSQNKNSNFVFI